MTLDVCINCMRDLKHKRILRTHGVVCNAELFVIRELFMNVSNNYIVHTLLICFMAVFDCTLLQWEVMYLAEGVIVDK